jgi:hypothetical protein
MSTDAEFLIINHHLYAFSEKYLFDVLTSMQYQLGKHKICQDRCLAFQTFSWLSGLETLRAKNMLVLTHEKRLSCVAIKLLIARLTLEENLLLIEKVSNFCLSLLDIFRTADLSSFESIDQFNNNNQERAQLQIFSADVLTALWTPSLLSPVEYLLIDAATAESVLARIDDVWLSALHIKAVVTHHAVVL